MAVPEACQPDCNSFLVIAVKVVPSLLILFGWSKQLRIGIRIFGSVATRYNEEDKAEKLDCYAFARVIVEELPQGSCAGSVYPR